MEQLRCAQTCRGLCSALEITTRFEKDAILEYAMLRDACTYPDIKVILNELILRRQKSIQLLEEAQVMLQKRFEVLEQIQDGFAM